MYKQALNREELQSIAYGNTTLLLEKLRASDKVLCSELKRCKQADQVAFLQGVSYAVDELIKILESDRN